MGARATTNETGKTAQRRLIKAGVGLVLLTVLVVLFMRSVRGTRAEPYSVGRDSLQPWTLAYATGGGRNDPMLVLRPPPELPSALFGQLFKRAMESMSAPATPGIPLMLRAELLRAQAGHPALTPEAIMMAARDAGLGGAPPLPRCLAHRRAGASGGDREQLYFVLFDAPAFVRFRQHLATLLNDGATPPADFDPALLSPALVLALVESTAERWLPLHADPRVDCVAPIAIAAATAPE
jgi:hypothetical protein